MQKIKNEKKKENYTQTDQVSGMNMYVHIANGWIVGKKQKFLFGMSFSLDFS